MRVFFSLVLAIPVILVVACGPSDPISSLCDKVANGPGCKGTDPKLCQSIAKQSVANAGACSSALTAALECVAQTEIYCSGGKARSPGDPGNTDSVTYSSGGYSIEILGKTCKDKYAEYMGCKECGDTPGYAEKKPGVGDPCGSGCATGLKCVTGFCTRECGGTTTTGPCRGKHYINELCAGIGTRKDVFCESTGYGQICLPECETKEECTKVFPSTDCIGNRCRPPDCGTMRTKSTMCSTSTTFQACFTCCNTMVGAAGRQDLVAKLKTCACGGSNPQCATECSDLCTKSFISGACTTCVMSATADNNPCACSHDAACAPGSDCGNFDACLRSCDGLP